MNTKRMLSSFLTLVILAALCGAFVLPAAAIDTGGFTDEVVRLVNEERAAAGMPALRANSRLSRAALTRAKEYAADPSLKHTRPDGTEFSTVLDDNWIAWTVCGENLAWGQATPAQVVAAWMKSAEHKKNILYDFDRIGVAVFESGGRLYWAQLFVRNDAGLFAGIWSFFAGAWNAIAAFFGGILGIFRASF